MPVAALVRMFSNGGGTPSTWVSSLSRADAVAAAISGTATATAVMATPIPAATADTDLSMRTWDRIAPYTNDTTFTTAPAVTVPSGQTVPEFVWNSTTLPGETRYFAMAYAFTPAAAATGVVAAATNFADNAHNYEVSIYDAAGTTVLATSVVLLDGNVTTPSIGLTEPAPFNWQTVRANSSLLSTALTAGTTYNLVVSYDAMNYLATDNTLPNPAALAFQIDAWTVT